jgi:hypothetical protein
LTPEPILSLPNMSTDLYPVYFGLLNSEMAFSRAEYTPITAPSFDETAGICAIVAVVDTR